MSEAAAAVRWLLDQSEPEARRIAVQQVPKVPAADALDLLLRALADDDWRVRKEAAHVARVLERRDEVVAALVAGLEESVNIGLRNAAVEALIGIGSDAVGVILEVLGRLGPDARKLAVEVLGGMADPRGVTALVETLNDEDLNVRVAAAEALGGAALAGDEARERAAGALTEALAGTRNTFLRIAALESLSRLDVHLPWTVVEPYVVDPLLRRHAIVAAATSREPAALRALTWASGDASPTIAREAVVALGDLFGGATENESDLEWIRDALQNTAQARVNVRRMAQDPDDSRGRGAALVTLGLLRDPSDVRILVAALGDDDVAERADAALRLFGPGVVAPLLDAARTAKPSIRAVALTMACSVGAELDSMRRALREALHDSAADVVACALEALGAIGEGTDLDELVKLMAHTDPRVAATASNAVAKLAASHADSARSLLRSPPLGQDPAALACVMLGAIATSQSLTDDDVKYLETALAHDAPKVRSAAIDALAQAGGHAAADAIVFALVDEEQAVKLAAVRALGRLGLVEPLRSLVTDTRDPLLAATALRALSETDPDVAFAAARPLTAHQDPALACVAVEAIGTMRRADMEVATFRNAREDALFAALEHPHDEVVKLALSLVCEWPGPRAFARLSLCLDHSSWEVRRLAAELLGQTDDPAAEALLRTRYGRENDPGVREAIASAVSLRPKGETSSSDRPTEAAPIRHPRGSG